MDNHNRLAVAGDKLTLRTSTEMSTCTQISCWKIDLQQKLFTNIQIRILSEIEKKKYACEQMKCDIVFIIRNPSVSVPTIPKMLHFFCLLVQLKFKTHT